MTAYSNQTKEFTTCLHKKRRLLLYAAILTIAISRALLSSSRSLLETSIESSSNNRTRNAKLANSERPLMPSWAEENIKPLRANKRAGEEVSLFWHIPKSGGTTVKKIYECFGQTLATAAGAGRRFIPDNNQIVVFNPYGTGNYVNVDVSTREGILRAKEMGLVESGKVDIIFATDVKFAAETLFDPVHPGRLFALFRHPIRRLVSKFYYVQSATWERSYDPKLKSVTLLEWANFHNTDHNFYLQKLSGRNWYELKERDLREAMRTLKRRFVVGLTDEMRESVHRFNTVMGIDDTSTVKGVGCMDEYFDGEEEKKMNAHEHPDIEEGSPEWNALYAKNEFDVKLYEYVVDLFAEQRDIVNDFTRQHMLILEKKVTQLIQQVERANKRGGKDRKSGEERE